MLLLVCPPSFKNSTNTKLTLSDLGVAPFGRYTENGEFEGSVAKIPHLVALHNALFHMVFATKIVSATSAQANDRKDVI